jgi:hypothetical protein
LFPTESDGPLERAVVPLTIAFPDTIAAGAGWRAEAYLMVGTSLCWRLKSVDLSRDGSRFLVSGTSVSASRGGPCATAIAFEWVELAGPPVEAGDYTIEGGLLCGALAVSENGASVRRALLAQGSVSADSTGWWFPSFTLDYRVENPHLLSGAGDVRIQGVVDSLRAESIELKAVEYVEPVEGG